MRKTQIAVIGYNEDWCTDIAKNIAYEVGKEIALSGSVLICGGLGGVMESACKGAKDNEGTTIGILPQGNFDLANKYCDIVIPTGIGYSRNFIIATSVDGYHSRWRCRNFNRGKCGIYAKKEDGSN